MTFTEQSYNVDFISFIKKNVWCDTHTTFPYSSLQKKNMILSAEHLYLNFIFHAFK